MLLLDFNKLSEAFVANDPFPYMVASGLLKGEDLAMISKSFPLIENPGVFPLSALHYGDVFGRLIEEIRSREIETLLGRKFDINLSGLPLMITVRGRCQKKDGRIHTDSKDKILTCLLYLNDPDWQADGGRLRLLRDGKDLNNSIAEVAPAGGNFIAFKRTDHSWHGHAPFEGVRRSIMFNWLGSNTALTKNLGRHTISAAFKKWGLFNGY